MGASFVIAFGFARIKPNYPTVERAGDGGSMHYALAERATLVSTFIMQCKNLIVGAAKYGHIA